MAAGERIDRITLAVGAVLLALYVVQGCLGLECAPLARIQQHETYKVASGCVLAGYLLHQSLMARRRVFDPVGVVAWHKLAGACAPIVLYLHASRFAYGYLLLLAIELLSTVALGLLHRPVVRTHVRWLYTWWLILHIATSACLVVLAGYHAVIALAYE